MSQTNHSYSFHRYLAAKKSVDDRALNRHVWQRLRRLWQEAHGDPAGQAPRVLELGAGTGIMLERLLEWDLLARAEYEAVDRHADNVRTARRRLSSWAESHAGVATSSGAHLRLWSEGGARRIDVKLTAADARAFLAQPASRSRYDLVVAHAFLDLVDVPDLAPLLHQALRAGGLLYATINFDGATIFEPVLDPELDALIEQLYHETMDEPPVEGVRAGESRTGRRLIPWLQAAGFTIEAAGASDWLLYGQDGRYAHDEAYFLHFIVHTVGEALRGRPELDAKRFERWLDARHQQVDAGELLYMAHQVDVLARRR